VFPSVVWKGAPATGRRAGALESVMSKALAVGALGELVKAKASFSSEGGGEGRQAWLLCKVLCSWAGSSDDNGGG
jgi:hypothetical protein